MTRGEIWWADLGLPFGSEPGFKRPVLIIQDDDFNRSKIKTIIVVPLTTNSLLAEAPGNVLFPKNETRLSKDSVAVVSQIVAVDKARMIEKETKLSNRLIEEIEKGILLVLGIKHI